jgi:ribosome biogenesis GTPase
MNMPTQDGLREGLVFKKSLGSYWVRVEERDFVCSVSGLLWKELQYPTADPSSIRPHVVAVSEIHKVDPVAIGDWVGFSDSGDGTGRIMEILPRKNSLSRRAPGPKPLEQVIVSNLDQAVIVIATVQPTPKWHLLDRYLVCAEAAGIPALICITKADLMRDPSIAAEIRNYESLGYRAVVTSAVSGEGIEAITECLKDRISVFLGKSGVGKTTLLNAIQPGLGLRVNEVSAATGKGKHTTSHLEMFELEMGGAIIDTPGIRELGLWNVPAGDLAGLFPEMRPCLGQCRFGADCTHTHEPDCAIKTAVAEGRIAERRYLSYVKLR